MTRVRRAVVRQLASIGQTFFVYNPWVGVAAIVVLAVAAPHLAIAGTIASVFARIVAVSVGAPQAFLDTGLVELNGWYLGLACATFFAVGPGLAVSILLGGALVALMAMAMHRVLAVWEVPLVIGPYVPVFWLLWSALATLAWTRPAALPAMPAPPDSPLLLVLLGGLRGVGQILFLPNAAAGAALAVVASIGDRWLGLAMVGASVAAVGVGYLAGTPAWQVETGLAGFTAALIAAAAVRRFAGIGLPAAVITVLTIPFLEVAAVRLAGAVGLHALSAPYVGLVWIFSLVHRPHDPDPSPLDRPAGRRRDGSREGDAGSPGAAWPRWAAEERGRSTRLVPGRLDNTRSAENVRDHAPDIGQQRGRAARHAPVPGVSRAGERATSDARAASPG
ncbi:MAG TPA: urea transporter [Candidatus Bathyarchaeia archaeon]|nr:urea transporter [Candidatus Bathyarchaeia archaeon]